MHPYGADRLRTTGGKIILHSPIPKGWVARKPKGVHAEFPGTAVQWDESYFEVIAVQSAAEGGVMYVLEPWRDDHVMRSFQHYDAETEARLEADYRVAEAQRKKSLLTSLSGMFFGHYPRHVQDHLQNELGVTPSRITLASCIPSVALLGICVWLHSDAKVDRELSPVPFWLWPIALFMFAESALRFFVAMSQNRGMGSLFGAFAYIAFWYITPNRDKWPSPYETSRGNKIFTLPPPDDVELRDSLEMRAAWFSLLSEAEQKHLADRYGFDYRKHAPGLAWVILVCATLGAVSSYVKVADSGSFSALVSLIVAGVLAVEQIRRLIAFKHGPAGSFLGIIVRPFVRRFLEHR